MGFYNLFTLDENGKPKVVSVKTDIPKFENTVQFDDFIQALPEEQRQQYLQEIANRKFDQVTIEPVD